MKNVRFGIDHPVVTVRDFARVRAQYERLGFAPSPVGHHPWGTIMSLLMFEDNFIEIISVEDASKFGTNAVDGFCYGRNVGRFLAREEGLGLVSLHSKDGRKDHAALTAGGLQSQGIIDFRRKVLRADGVPDEAVVTLGLFLNTTHRDFSHFLCHQHKPELVWVPGWMDHPNGACGVQGVWYVANDPQPLAERLVHYYGDAAIRAGDDGVHVNTGCGWMHILTPAQAAARFSGVALPKRNSTDEPHGIALTVSTRKLPDMPSLLRRAGIESNRSESGSLLVAPKDAGNVILEFTSPE